MFKVNKKDTRMTPGVSATPRNVDSGQVVRKTKIRDIKVIANLFFKSIVGLFQIN